MICDPAISQGIRRSQTALERKVSYLKDPDIYFSRINKLYQVAVLCASASPLCHRLPLKIADIFPTNQVDANQTVQKNACHNFAILWHAFVPTIPADGD